MLNLIIGSIVLALFLAGLAAGGLVLVRDWLEYRNIPYQEDRANELR